MKTEIQEKVGPTGTFGSYGPNDRGYLCIGIRNAAQQLVMCSSLWSEGHYAHSNARVMPKDHPIAVALSELAKLDKEVAVYNNTTHDPKLFEPYVPSLKNQARWDNEKYKGVAGAKGN